MFAPKTSGWPLPLDPGTVPPSGAIVPAETSGLAIASLVCGTCAFIFPLFPSIAAIILGHKARSQIRQSLGRLRGDGLALAGLILGYLWIGGVVIIIAAIAIPNMLRSQLEANEAAAVGSLRTLNTASVTYSTSYGGFPASLDALGGESNGSAPSATAAQLIGTALQSGAMNGYNFIFSAGTSDSAGNIDYYSIKANPITPGTTGGRYFFTDQSGVIRAETSGPANQNSPPIS